MGPPREEIDSFSASFVYVDRHIMALLANRKISTKEALLLAMIAGLSKRESGCTATNPYFAARLGFERRNVAFIISSLADRKFIRIKHKKSKRILIQTVVPNDDD